MLRMPLLTTMVSLLTAWMFGFPNDFWPFSMNGAFPIYHSYSEGTCTLRQGSLSIQNVLMVEDFWPPLQDPWIRTSSYLSIETLNGKYVKGMLGDIGPQFLYFVKPRLAQLFHKLKG